MTRRFVRYVTSLAVGVGAVLLLAPPAGAQTKVTGGVRGRVVDERGAGVPDVKIDMEYLGESRQKITKTQQTDKKGGFVRMGLAEGRWKFTFTREGFKTYAMEMELSIGGFSETPDIVLTHGASSAAAAATAGQPVAAVLPPTPESNKAGETYTKAVEAAQAGRYDEAKPYAEQAAQLAPNLFAAHHALGRIQFQTGDVDKAIDSLETARRLAPDSPEVRFSLARAYAKAGRAEEAARERAEFVKLDKARRTARSGPQSVGGEADEPPPKN